MKRRLMLLSVVPALLLATACAQVEEAAQNAASSAASQVATAAVSEVKKQVCAVVSDGLVSVQEKQVLSGLASTADAAGVPAEITGPLKDVARAGDQVPAAAVDSLKSTTCSAE